MPIANANHDLTGEREGEREEERRRLNREMGGRLCQRAKSTRWAFTSSQGEGRCSVSMRGSHSPYRIVKVADHTGGRSLVPGLPGGVKLP